MKLIQANYISVKMLQITNKAKALIEAIILTNNQQIKHNQ